MAKEVAWVAAALNGVARRSIGCIIVALDVVNRGECRGEEPEVA